MEQSCCCSTEMKTEDPLCQFHISCVDKQKEHSPHPGAVWRVCDLLPYWESLVRLLEGDGIMLRRWASSGGG